MSTTQALVAILNNPSAVKTSSQAKQLHAHAIRLTAGSDSFNQYTALILSIYANFNLFQYCISLFKSFRKRPPIKAWKSMITCSAASGNFVESVTLFKKMRASGQSPDGFVFPGLLKACTCLSDLRLGQAVHGCVVRLGVDTDLFTGNALMNMYAKLECKGVRHVFGSVVEPKEMTRFSNHFLNLIECPSPVEHDDSAARFDGFQKAVTSHVRKNVSDLHVDKGLKFFHHNSILDGSSNNQLQYNGGEVGVHCVGDSVRKVFEVMPIRDVVSWNTVIGGHVQNGMPEEALLTVKDMRRANVKPDSFTLSTILPIFAQHMNVVKGKEIHGYAVRHGFDKDLFMGSSLVDMYANCNRLEDSHRVFCLSPRKDKVYWNSIIAACVQNGKDDDGLKLFREMLMAGIEPVAFSFSSIIPACAHLTTLCLGKQLHGYIIRRGFEDSFYIASSLMDMYAKCGNLRIARWIFNKMEFRDAVSWTTMIMSYAFHGHASDAILFFKEMLVEGVKPNAATFVAVLTACSHAGLVDEAWEYFWSMTQNYEICPEIEHYAAVADLLGRAGRLDEAFKLIDNMHIEPTVGIWSALLSACRVHKNIELAEVVTQKILKIDPLTPGAYLLLSRVYNAAGRWKDAAKLRTKMRKKGMTKTAACSWIEVKNKMHVFFSGDESHLDYPWINKALQDLSEWIKLDGYVPETSIVLNDFNNWQ